MFFVACDNDRESAELASRVRDFFDRNHVDHVSGGDISCVVFDVAVAVGRDGFLLSFFRKVGNLRVPVLCISPQAGVFSEADPHNFRDVLKKVTRGDYSVTERLRLEANISGRRTSLALNEIGVFPVRSAEVMRYSLAVDGKTYFKDTADGVILSTPTGSTGYSFSAGGPVVVGDAGIFTVTAVSSVRKAYTSIAVPASSRVRIFDIEAKSSASAVFDGGERIDISGGDIEIFVSPYPALFVVMKGSKPIIERMNRGVSEGLDPALMRGLPASAKLVHRVLSYSGEMTQKEIAAETYLPARTVRYALDVLIEAGVLRKKPNLSDVRQSVYWV